jgi:hypothetical protein
MPRAPSDKHVQEEPFRGWRTGVYRHHQILLSFAGRVTTSPGPISHSSRKSWSPEFVEILDQARTTSLAGVGDEDVVELRHRGLAFSACGNSIRSSDVYRVPLGEGDVPVGWAAILEVYRRVGDAPRGSLWGVSTVGRNRCGLPVVIALGERPIVSVPRVPVRIPRPAVSIPGAPVSVCGLIPDDSVRIPEAAVSIPRAPVSIPGDPVSICGLKYRYRVTR